MRQRQTETDRQRQTDRDSELVRQDRLIVNVSAHGMDAWLAALHALSVGGGGVRGMDGWMDGVMQGAAR